VQLNAPEISTVNATSDTTRKYAYRKRKSIFKDLGLTASDASPREHKLMKMVRSREGRIRKLKESLRRRNSTLKELSTGRFIEEINPVFKGLYGDKCNFLNAIIIFFRDVANDYTVYNGPNKKL